METAKPKLSIVRRILYGLCGICGPKVKVELSPVNNYHQPASRPGTSQSGKKRKKRPANVSVQGPGSLSPSPQSPRSADVQPPMGENYYQHIPAILWDHYGGNGQSNFSGAPAPNMSGGYETQIPEYCNVPANNFGENPPYEIIGHPSWNNQTPANNAGCTWAHPHHATEMLGQIPWQSQPKDDGSMLRLFKTVDGRLMDHILNFYIAPDSVPHQTSSDNPLSPEDPNRKLLDKNIPGWWNLLSKQEYRISILRAIIALVVLGDKAFLSASPHSNYDLGNMINRIAKNTHDLTKSFALKGTNEDARLRSMQALVSATAELYSTISAQPTRFDVAWGKSGHESMLDTTTMEAVLNSDQTSRTVRATVFPGLLKQYGTNDLPLPLAKIQVLLY